MLSDKNNDLQQQSRNSIHTQVRDGSVTLRDMVNGKEGSQTARALMKPEAEMSYQEIFYAHGPKRRRPAGQQNNSLNTVV